MVSSIDSQSSSLTQMFFQNRFPEPKEEPLFDLENSRKSNGDSSTSASQQQSGTEQASFAQAIQNAALARNAPKEESKIQKQNSELLQGQTEDREKDAYEELKIKAQYNTLFWS